MPLSEEFKTFDKKAGCYFISEMSSPQLRSNQKIILKIGMSSNLKRRLNSYHTCWKESFYTYTVIITKDKNDAKKLEKIIHKHLKENGRQYKHKEFIARNSKIGNEFFETEKGVLMREINEALSKAKAEGIKYRVVNLHERYFKLE